MLSAFVTVQGFQWILNRVTRKGLTGQLVVRWRPDDLLSGASSLDVYDMAKEAGWEVFVSPDLHAKSILIDKTMVFIGSANVTGYGLSIVPGANRELGVKFEASTQDINVFQKIISESTLVTDSLVGEIKEFLTRQVPIKYYSSGGEWPDYLKIKFDKPPEKLWVADMLWSSPGKLTKLEALSSDEAKFAMHDLRVLGLVNSQAINSESLKESFLNSQAWRWLQNLLCSAENHELYFGCITASLHNALLDDPKPYRQEVKGLVQNLYSWAEILSPELIIVDRPNHSQRMKYLA